MLRTLNHIIAIKIVHSISFSVFEWNKFAFKMCVRFKLEMHAILCSLAPFKAYLSNILHLCQVIGCGITGYNTLFRKHKIQLFNFSIKALKS